MANPILKTLQDIRQELGYKANNRRLDYALSIAISELIQCSDKSINADIRRYQEARKNNPRK